MTHCPPGDTLCIRYKGHLYKGHGLILEKIKGQEGLITSLPEKNKGQFVGHHIRDIMIGSRLWGHFRVSPVLVLLRGPAASPAGRGSPEPSAGTPGPRQLSGNPNLSQIHQHLAEIQPKTCTSKVYTWKKSILWEEPINFLGVQIHFNHADEGITSQDWMRLVSQLPNSGITLKYKHSCTWMVSKIWFDTITVQTKVQTVETHWNLYTWRKSTFTLSHRNLHTN